MNIIVPIRLVPDLVEELKVDENGLALDQDWLRMKINEFDDHALEEAILLKEKGLGEVTVIALEADEIDDALFTAVAKGADRIIKLSGEGDQSLNSHALASTLAPVVKRLEVGLILTGVQANNDLDGTLGPLLAETLGIPYVGYISGIALNNGQLVVHKEYPGGLIAEMEMHPPAVLGIQAAEQPPRYVAFSKIRQASKTASIEEMPANLAIHGEGLQIDRMFQPESEQRAEMITGSPSEVADRLIEIFKRSGVL